MKKGILIVFGNIDFNVDDKGQPIEAIINEIEQVSLTEDDGLAALRAVEVKALYGYPAYIIPQLYPGTIIWSK